MEAAEIGRLFTAAVGRSDRGHVRVACVPGKGARARYQVTVHRPGRWEALRCQGDTLHAALAAAVAVLAAS